MPKPISRGCFTVIALLNLLGVVAYPFLAFGTAMSAFNSPSAKVQADLACLEFAGWVWSPPAMFLLHLGYRPPSAIVAAIAWPFSSAIWRDGFLRHRTPILDYTNRQTRKWLSGF